MIAIAKLAAIAGASAMALAGIIGTTAASAATGPSGTQAPGGNTPAAAGRTFINMRGIYRTPYSEVVYQPRTFNLIGPRSASVFIYSTPTRWFGGDTVGEGPMYGVRSGHKVFVGNVTMVFSHRMTNGHYLYGGHYNYYENVRITGIRPGNGGTVQNWHWSWTRDNWVS